MMNFVSGLYKIIITTYYINNTLSGQEAWEAIQWPIVEKQKIIFKYKDSICAVFDFPAKKITRQTNKGKSVAAAEMVIWNANLINGRKTVLFGILEATGLCNGAYCPTYDGVFKLDGTPVYQIYKDETKQQTLIIGKKTNKEIPVKEDLNHKLDSIYDSNDISGEILNNSWISRRKIGINK